MDYFFMGDAELLTAFRFIGIEGIAVKNSSQAVALFRKITENREDISGFSQVDSLPDAGSLKVLILTEEAAHWIGDYMIEWIVCGRYPLVVEIPGIMGKLSGKKTIVESIREAIGIHM